MRALRILPPLALAASLVAPAAAHAAASPTLDLRTARAVEIVGARAGDHATGAGAAGDVNGDGLADVVVSAPGADPKGRTDAGAIYVVFGRRFAQARTRLAVPRPAQGFEILGAQPRGRLTRAVAAGDVNGDGLGDVLVAALDEDRSRGAAYLVFGKRDGASVDLAHLGAGGVRITATVPTVQLGYGLAGGRDVNGDGRPDVVVGTAPGAAGATDAYVIFGGTQPGELHVPDLGAAGYVVHGVSGNVSLADDMNGDGRAEIVAASATGPGGQRVARVAFGRPDGLAVDLGALGDGGFSVVAPLPAGAAGGPGGVGLVAAGGDIDGDGRGDLVVGTSLVATPTTAAQRRQNKLLKKAPNRMAVVFGEPGGEVSLTAPSPRALTITAPAPKDPYMHFERGHGIRNGFTKEGLAVNVLGDLDGDGRAEFALNGSDTVRGRKDAGSVWVVRGQGPAALQLARLGADAVRIDGAYAGDGLDAAAPAGGDFDGDGRPDVLLGASSATRNGRAHAGLAWIVSGVAR